MCILKSHYYRSFNHPNVLALLGVLFDTETVTLITNLVDGKDLHRIIFDESKNMEVGCFDISNEYKDCYGFVDDIFDEDRRSTASCKGSCIYAHSNTSRHPFGFEASKHTCKCVRASCILFVALVITRSGTSIEVEASLKLKLH